MTDAAVPGVAMRRSVGSEAAAPFPLQAPADASQRARWSRALEFYGWRENGTPVPRGAAALVGGAPVVLCLEPEFAAYAALLSAGLGAELVRARYGTAADRLREFGVEGRPVTVVAHAARPRAAVLQHWQQLHEDLAWGVLAAWSVAGFSFAVAKVLARAARPRTSWLHLDAIEGRWRDDSGAGGDLDDAVVTSLLFSRDWGLIVLAAHGENGHALLGRIMLCGLVGPRETYRDGGFVGGCAAGAEGVSCKRARPGLQVRHVFDIRAEQIVHLSCTNFTVAGDLYPSSVSLVTGAFDGYACGVVASDRAMPHHVPTAESFVAWWEAGAELGLLTDVENDRQRRLLGSLPYFTAGVRLAVFPAPSNAVGSAPVGRVHVTPDPVHPVVDVEPIDADTSSPTMLRGARWCRVLSDTPAARWRWTNASAHVADFEQWLGSLDAKITRAVDLAVAARQLTSVPVDTGPLDGLRTVVVGGRRLLTAIVDDGVWRREADQLPELAHEYEQLWQRAAVNAWDDHLLSHHNAEDVLTDGWGARRRERSAACLQCGALVTVERPVIGPAESLTTCPHCGPGTYRQADGPALAIQVPPSLAPGQRFEVVVTLDRPATLVTHVKDNGTNVRFHRSRQPVDVGVTSVSVTVPQDAAADLITLRVMAVSGLGLSYVRTRRPCMRFDTPSPDAHTPLDRGLPAGSPSR